MARLHRSLSRASSASARRPRAAAIGLVDRDATLSVQLLEPLLDDPSHDVRVAMLPALAAAYAKTNTPEKLADLLDDSETPRDAPARRGRRVRDARAHRRRASPPHEAALAKIVADGPPMARVDREARAGLLAGKADGLAFLQELVP